MGSQKSKARLEVRQAEISDAEAIVELIGRCYTEIPGYSPGEIRAQINNFPDGCFVAILDGRVVG